MKKIFSLFAAVLFAGSMMADYVPVSSVAVGDVVVMGCADVNMELSGISTTSTKYGTGTLYQTEPAGLKPLTIEEGTEAGTFAFRTADDTYLTWTAGNSLNVNGTKSKNTSWKLTFKTDYVEIANAADETRIIWWNGTSPRFACYTGKSHNKDNYYGPTLFAEGSDMGVIKTLKYIEIAGMTTEFDTGDKFKFDGTVTATYSVVQDDVPQADESKVVAPTSVSTPDMTTAGEKEVTVSFTDGGVTKEAKYTINVKEHVTTPGTYNVALNNTFFGCATGNNSAEQSAKSGDISVIAGCESSAQTKTNYYADHVRFYKDSYLKLSVPEGYVITSIELTAFDTKWDGGISSAPEGYDADSKSWAGEANEVDFTFGAQNRIASVKVTFAAADATKTPAISGATDFFDEVEVAITCTTEGAKIYYTLDGTEPSVNSAEYTAPFVLTKNTTVKAIAIKGGDKSDVAEKEFRNLSFASFEDLIDANLESNTAVKVSFKNLAITKFYNSNSERHGVYFVINEVEYEIYHKTAVAPDTWAEGGYLSGTIIGNWTYYSTGSIWEIVPTTTDWEWSELTYGSTPTAIDNTAIENKAVKTIENGMIIIEKAGVRYNVLGQIVR